MKKFSFYLMSLLAGATVMLSSCDKKDKDEKDETPKQEVVTPSSLGQQAQAIIGKLGDGSEDALFSAASRMTKDELDIAAKTLVEFNKNQNDASWVSNFVNAAATSNQTAEQVKELITKAVQKLLGFGLLNEKTTSDELVSALQLFLAENSTYEDGVKMGKQYETLFDTYYESHFKDLDPNNMEAAMEMYNSLPQDAQNSLLAAVAAYNNNKENADWKSGFLQSVALKYSDAEKAKITELFNTFAPLVAALGM